MLLNKTLTENSIVCLKLGNGDELIGKMVASSATEVTLTKPMLMVITQDQRGQPGIQLVPFWMVGVDREEQFPINRSHIVCMAKANADAAGGYSSQTSGLVVPKSGLIT